MHTSHNRHFGTEYDKKLAETPKETPKGMPKGLYRGHHNVNTRLSKDYLYMRVPGKAAFSEARAFSFRGQDEAKDTEDPSRTKDPDGPNEPAGPD